jgi:preprotein translocase SecE subunit
MKRVNWSTRKTIIGSTWVVIGACVLLALMLFVTDYGLQTIFRAMRLL